MMRRFCSGSSTPASAFRKRSPASTETRRMPRCSRNSASTSARSPPRRSPWSTKMQVSRSPRARCTSAAATEESTPPERPQTACPSPTWSRTAATASSMKASIVQEPAQPQMPCTKLRRISEPPSVCTTSGWNWRPQIGRLSWRTAAKGEPSLVASTRKPGRRSTLSPWLIQTVRSAPPGRPAKSASSPPSFSWARPYSRSSAGSTTPPRPWASSWSP